MDYFTVLAYLISLVIVVTIAMEIYMLRFNTFLAPKKRRAGRFFNPIKYPEDGEDMEICDLCHGPLGPEEHALCSCGKRFHLECIAVEDCPLCGNDCRHMHFRMPKVVKCPICLRDSAGGFCKHCEIIIPKKNGTFKCSECGGVVFTSDPCCRKCGCRYLPRTTKGYMSKVRSRH